MNTATPPTKPATSLKAASHSAHEGKTAQSTEMKALFCPRYGSPDVLEVRHLPKQTPKAGQIQVRITASAVSQADTMMRAGTPFFARLMIGLTRPKHPVLGTGFAGVVEAIGEGCERFKVGDKIYGETALDFGANAEYLCLDESSLLSHQPEQLSDAQCAPLCDGALTAWNFLHRLGEIKAGDKVLINGASGSVGSAAVQIAKAAGAEVTALCSKPNHDWVAEIGADHLVDYRNSDITKSDQEYDIIFDCVGKLSFGRCKKILTPEGYYLSPVLTLQLLINMLATKCSKGKKALFSATGLLPVPQLQGYLEQLEILITNGQLTTAMDREFALEEGAEAHRYVESMRKKGSIVLRP
ncbi:NAD(P)-dependent alcohol dehydrogenase [Oceanospirillum sanctuarii]|uniref:NAD(P)-dependent alcohol dehydrogenase n=1 Tax=Oceanospirillum sanctuarii TaxID=1434821 RepID=UPI001C3C84AE|nr:NAD(P)-dependent alcohol dehydrogenase [Oceanospirillum sanctuarii]